MPKLLKNQKISFSSSCLQPYEYIARPAVHSESPGDCQPRHDHRDLDLGHRAEGREEGKPG